MRKRKMILGVIITASTLYGVTFLNIGTWLSAPFISAKGFGSRDSNQANEENNQRSRHHHGDEPFIEIKCKRS